MARLELSAGDYAVTIAPEAGGSLQSFTWRGEPLMRTAAGPGALDAACFPLVPFSNRVARGRFEWEGRAVELAPNFPGQDHPHPLHGFGWLTAWDVLETTQASAVLEHRYPGGEWPWPYLARQTVTVRENGLELSLTIENLSEWSMPAGLGFHPYFPCNDQTMLRARHRGEWQNSAHGLPVRLVEAGEAIDWWHGQPVGSRAVDTVYSDRQGDMVIEWPDRRLSLAIRCSKELDQTAIFVPEADWFCVEPVTHRTNALNGEPDEIVALQPGAKLSVSVWLGII